MGGKAYEKADFYSCSPGSYMYDECQCNGYCFQSGKEVIPEKGTVTTIDGEKIDVN